MKNTSLGDQKVATREYCLILRKNLSVGAQRQELTHSVPLMPQGLSRNLKTLEFVFRAFCFPFSNTSEV